MAVAPFVSLSVIPFAFSRLRPRGPAAVEVADAAREGPAHAQLEEAATDLTLRHGARVRGLGRRDHVLRADADERRRADRRRELRGTGGLTTGLTGFVFNVMLIVRAPLQLFQAIQTSILPHLAGLEARESPDEFHHAIRVTVLVIAAFAGAVALGLLAIGPSVMTALLGDKGFHYGRLGLALVGLGMGFHLISGTLNQAALARGRAADRRGRLAVAAALFVLFVATHAISNEVTRVEVAYFTSTLVLSGLLWAVYRRR